MLPAEGRARLKVEQFALMVVTPCPLVAIGGGAQEDRRRAEVCPEIVTAGGEPKSLWVSPLRHVLDGDDQRARALWLRFPAGADTRRDRGT